MSKMSPLDLARKLKLPREVIEQLSCFKVPEDVAARLKEAFSQDPKVFEIAAREYDNSDLLVLSLYLRWAMDAHFLYAIRGMDWSIFDATFQDLTDSCHDFFNRTGKAGLNHWEWIGLAIKMQLFRLGKLEFRPNVLKEELVMDGQAYPAGSKVLEVCHCPTDTPVTQIPTNICCLFDDELVICGENRRLYMTLGQFSIIRLERDAQLIVPVLDYSLPTKECCDSPGCAEDPCEMFARIPFPENQFAPTGCDRQQNCCDGYTTTG